MVAVVASPSSPPTYCCVHCIKKPKALFPWVVSVGHSVSVWHFLLLCCLEQLCIEEVACAWSTVRQRAAVWIGKFYFCWVRLQMELYRIWLVLGYVGRYWVILTLTALCWPVLSYIGCYRVMLAGTELCWLVLRYTAWRCVCNMQQAYRCVLFVSPVNSICRIQP
jgi:hypothetical protein